MKIVFEKKKEVVDFIVDFYQSDIANRIMRFMDDYGDECDAAVNRERYIQEEAEDDGNKRMKELLEEEVMKVRSCGNICSCLPVMELNGKDITSELWHIILDAPLAYVCYGGVVRHLPTYKGIERDGIYWGDNVENDLNLAGKFQNYLEEKMESMIG